MTTFGRIDVVIANAGIAPPVESVRFGAERAFDRVLDVNLHGVVNTVRATLPALLATDGYLLIVSSLYAIVNGALSAPYAMSKSAVEAFGRSLRVEFAGSAVDVGIAYFGFIDTMLLRDAMEKAGIAELRNSLPSSSPNPYRSGGPGRRSPRGYRPGITHHRAKVDAPTLPCAG